MNLVKLQDAKIKFSFYELTMNNLKRKLREYSPPYQYKK